MGIQPTEWIWHNGAMKRWHEATTHVLAHGLHYGSSVFEGIRAYDTPDGTAFFRLRDHIRRLKDSAAIYRIDLPYSIDELIEVCHDLVRQNDLSSAYIRPVVYRGAGSFSLAPGEDTPVEVAIAAIEWGAYLGEEGLKHGIDACISSWRRPSSACMPILSKAGGHYLNAQLIAQEAQRNGFTEGIALNADGHASEGSGENLFIVRDGVIHTPPASASILEGITRDTVFRLAESMNVRIAEAAIPRELLYIADEIFLTGTAAEITPVRSIDRAPIGAGAPGPITRSLQDTFFGLFDGSTGDQWDWLDVVQTDQTADMTRRSA